MDKKVDEVRRYISDNFDLSEMKIQLGVSGGKDSTACYLLFFELGLDFVPMFADTGNEHPATVEHAMTLSDRTGGPEIMRLERKYSDERFAVRRDGLRKLWSRPHRIKMGARRGEMMPAFPQETIDEALAVLHPSGNQFLDMILLHGMIPQRRNQFCTIELKLEPVAEVFMPWMDDGWDVLTCSGVRADESNQRKEYPRHEDDRRYTSHQMDVVQFRPILDWKAEDCFAMHKRHGVEPNPLYKEGMRRVGCMPCIHANQPELVEIFKRFPEQLERIEKWEKAAAKVSRWAAFHGADSVGFFGPKTIKGLEGRPDRTMFYTATEYVTWVGDKPKHDLEADAPACSSVYGLCE